MHELAEMFEEPFWEERYRSHEFGDSMLLLRGFTGGRATSSSAPPGP